MLNWLRESDRDRHFLAGVLISLASFILLAALQQYKILFLVGGWQGYIICQWPVLIAALYREWIGAKWDWKDIWATMLGGIWFPLLNFTI